MVELDEKRYVQSLKPFLMDVCFAWANGSPFTDVCKLTDIFEGIFFILYITSFIESHGTIINGTIYSGFNYFTAV